MQIPFKTKLIVCIIGIALLVCLAAGIIIIQDMRRQFEGAIDEKAKSDLANALEIVEYMRPGFWQVRNGKLYKGETLINDDNELVDKIGLLTNDTVTIFLNNTRVATNVIRDGLRASGTTAAEYVTEKVLKNGQVYVGEAEVVGIKYQTCYAPIKNNLGEIIGMFYIGVSKNLADRLYQSFTGVAVLSARIALLFALAATCFIPVDAWSTFLRSRTSSAVIPAKKNTSSK